MNTRIKSKQITNLNEYIDSTKDRSHQYYRGHADANWKLKPTLFRIHNSLCCSKNINDFEEQILKVFKRHSPPYLKQEPKTLIDWLVLGQHFGLPTRLLDWTENPLVALFFALIELKECESAVWMIDPGNWYSIDLEKELNELDEYYMFFPKSIDNRIISQKSCFTIHPLNSTPIEDDFENGEASTYLDLMKICIPNDIQLKKKILLELYNFGIDYQFIFPDMTGLSKKIVYELQNDIPNE